MSNVTTPAGDPGGSSVPAPSEELVDYARKTYRYLRLAIVAMVVALGVSIVDVYWESKDLETSISRYYYEETHAIFIGALVMIGVCLIAIRGESDFEETALNYAGMLAPVVALVPTTAPAKGLTVNTDTIGQNLVAMGVAGIVTVIVALLLASWLRQQRLARPLKTTTVAGLVLASATLVALRYLYVEHGTTAAHNVAAVLMFVALWTVVTRNAARHLGTRSEQLASVTVAVVLVLGGVGTVIGVAGLSEDAPAAWALLALVPAVVLLVAAVPAWRTGESVRAALGRLARLLGHHHSDGDGDHSQRDYYCLWYAVVAVVMAAAPLILAAWPGDFDTKVFWVEVAALVPFAVFWLVQTIEKWNDVVEVDDRTTWATPGTAA